MLQQSMVSSPRLCETWSGRRVDARMLPFHNVLMVCSSIIPVMLATVTVELLFAFTIITDGNNFSNDSSTASLPPRVAHTLGVCRRQLR